VFLLSPAHCGGRRAQLLLRESADFDLARRLRNGGVPLGEVFSFVSGLYFRGKLAYASAFTRPSNQTRARNRDALVITTNRGLVPVDEPVTLDDLRAMATGDISVHDEAYRAALERDVAKLVQRLRPDDRVVLLGSIATGKYADVLAQTLGERLLFPAEFVGRGDMSRGGLMLRCADARRELTYIPVAGAVRHGPRPPRLAPRRS
jgi:hypothetical protein